MRQCYDLLNLEDVIVVNSNLMYMIDYFTYSFNKHLLNIYHQSYNLGSAGKRVMNKTEIFTFIYLFLYNVFIIYLFIYGCVGSSLLHAGSL